MSSDQKPCRLPKQNKRTDSPQRNENDSKERKKERKKGRKSRKIAINYDNPTISKGHAHVTEGVESMNICSNNNSKSRQQNVENQSHDDKNWETAKLGKRWREIEMKRRGLVDRKGCYKEQPIDDDIGVQRGGEQTDGDSTVHIPLDEEAIKQSGYVDHHGHHLTEDSLQPRAKPSKAASNPCVPNSLSSLPEAVNLRDDSNANSELADSELAVTLRDTVDKGENILNDLKYRHEYIEYRVGDKGRAMAVWPDGTKDTYDFTGDTIYQIPRKDT